MIKNTIEKICIEGPDLSGKSTLFEMLHKATNYRWNVQDRSSLSMVVHAKHYNRSDFFHIESFKKDLHNLNNFIIILLPPWEMISKRFISRGDEIQNLVSLKSLYDIFSEAASEFENFPNVVVLRKEIDDFILAQLVNNLVLFENLSFSKVGNLIKLMCINADQQERVGVNFTSYDDGNFLDFNSAMLEYEKEKDYYQEITHDLKKKIKDELNGNNEYCLEQGHDSRRFIYTSNTCISLAHFLFRDSVLDCKFFIRSSDVKDTLVYDLNFLKYLSSVVCLELSLPEDIIIRLNVLINSAHIPNTID